MDEQPAPQYDDVQAPRLIPPAWRLPVAIVLTLVLLVSGWMAGGAQNRLLDRRVQSINSLVNVDGMQAAIIADTSTFLYASRTFLVALAILLFLALRSHEMWAWGSIGAGIVVAGAAYLFASGPIVYGITVHKPAGLVLSKVKLTSEGIEVSDTMPAGVTERAYIFRTGNPHGSIAYDMAWGSGAGDALNGSAAVPPDSWDVRPPMVEVTLPSAPKR